MSFSKNIAFSQHFTQQPVSSSQNAQYAQYAQYAQHAQTIKGEILSQRHVEEGTSPRSKQLTPKIEKSLNAKTIGSISLSKDEPQSLNAIFNAANERINKCVNSPQDESFKANGPDLKYEWKLDSHSQEKAEVYFRKGDNNNVFRCAVDNHSDLILPEHFKNSIASKVQKTIDGFIAEHNLVKTPGRDLLFKFQCVKTNTDGEIEITPYFRQSIRDGKKSSVAKIALEPFTISFNGEAVGDSILPPKQFQDLIHKAENALTEERYTVKMETTEAEKVPDAKDITIKNQNDAINKKNKTIEELRNKLADLEKENRENEGKLESDAEVIGKLRNKLAGLEKENRENEDKLELDAEVIGKLRNELQNKIRENEAILECKAKIEDVLNEQTKEIGELNKELSKSNFHPVLRPVAKSLGMTLGGILLLVAASPAFADMLKSIIHSSNADTVDEKEAIGDYDEVGDNAYNLALENQVNSDKEAYYALQEKEDLNGTLSAEEQKEKERLSQYYSQDGLEPKFSVDNILPEFTDDPHFTEPAEKARTSTIETQKADDLKVMNEATDHSVNETSQKFMPWLIGGGTAALAFAGLRLAKTAAHNLPINHAIRAEQRASADSPYQPGAYINMNMNIDKKIDSHQSRYHNILHI